MAIGSAPEIGSRFGRFKMNGNIIDAEDMRLWYRVWKERVGDDLLGGWGTLQSPPRYPNGDIPEGRHTSVPPPATRHEE